jgi:hypothetical protein
MLKPTIVRLDFSLVGLVIKCNSLLYYSSEVDMTEHEPASAPASAIGQHYYYLGLAAVVAVILLASWLLFRSPPAEETVIQPPAVVETLPEREFPPTITDEPEVSDVPETEQMVEPEVEPDMTREPDSTELVTESPELEVELPPLNESDPEVGSALLDLSWQPGLAGLFVQEDMIRRFVVLTDNVSRGQISSELQVVQQPDQPFVAQAEADGEVYRLDPAGYQRYEPYLALLESVPVATQVQLLQQYQPLFEEAFNELGYPDTSFNERLIQAIDYVLDQPVRDGVFMLERPSVMYQFADADLEAMSDVQKQLIRMGPDNQQRLHNLLQRLKNELKAQEAAN